MNGSEIYAMQGFILVFCDIQEEELAESKIRSCPWHGVSCQGAVVLELQVQWQWVFFFFFFIDSTGSAPQVTTTTLKDVHPKIAAQVSQVNSSNNDG